MPAGLEPEAQGKTWVNVGLSDDEMQELIFLIDDEAVDEELLRGIRRKLVNRRKKLRRRVRE